METPNTHDGEATSDWYGLVKATIQERHSPQNAAKMAALRHAAVPATEVKAYAYTEPYLADLSEVQRVGARRAAGICAKHTRSPDPDQWLPVGASLRLLEAKNGSGVTDQVGALPLLDLENAAQLFDQLVGRCSSAGIPVDFIDLARTLMRWGNGVTEESREARAQVVRDFYTHTTKTK